jgi:hypothetical protein
VSPPGDHGETETDIHYVRRRYLTAVNLRRAITEVVNATLAVRHLHLWGEATTTASDSTKFGVWDNNLLTEWHARYRGPGVMIYWHVERKALCCWRRRFLSTDRHRLVGMGRLGSVCMGLKGDWWDRWAVLGGCRCWYPPVVSPPVERQALVAFGPQPPCRSEPRHRVKCLIAVGRTFERTSTSTHMRGTASDAQRNVRADIARSGERRGSAEVVRAQSSEGWSPFRTPGPPRYGFLGETV